MLSLLITIVAYNKLFICPSIVPWLFRRRLKIVCLVDCCLHSFILIQRIAAYFLGGLLHDVVFPASFDSSSALCSVTLIDVFLTGMIDCPSDCCLYCSFVFNGADEDCSVIVSG